MNGNANTRVYASSNGQQMPDNFIFQTVDPSQEDDSDSDSASAPYTHAQGGEYNNAAAPRLLRPGKKTKGRVKIKMEFIDNKLRRYTTFSKRKTGLMKKAYELATLTGTQVMLLVASETGHVYTFATRKLQPMITSESGKALIQTCLNSPDPPPGTNSGNSLEQRMNPSGFEETDLSCTVGEEEQKTLDGGGGGKPVFPSASNNVTVQPASTTQQQQLGQPPILSHIVKSQKVASTIPAKAIISTSSNPITSLAMSCKKEPVSSDNVSTTNSISTMQIPVILSQGGTISMLQTPDVSVAQTISIPQIKQSSSISSTVVKPTALSHVITALEQSAANSQTNSSGELNTPLPVSTPSLNIMQNMTPGIVMYHTPQGVVYATPTQNLHDRTIFNFSQPPASISMTQADQLSGQQFITIPVGGTSLMQLANPPTPNSSNSTSAETDQRNQPPNKKAKK